MPDQIRVLKTILFTPNLYFTEHFDPFKVLALVCFREKGFTWKDTDKGQLNSHIQGVRSTRWRSDKKSLEGMLSQ